MKIKVNRKSLVKSISIAQKAISSRTTTQILEGILLVAKDNNLTLIASDTEISIKTSLHCVVEKEGKIVVNSRLFGEIIRKLQDDTIDIEINDSTMNIKCLNSEFNISIQGADEYPELPSINSDKIINLRSHDFIDAIRKTSFAVSIDETRIIFTGVLIDINEEKINFVALDGFRMALKSIKNKGCENTNIIVPAKALNELVKIIDEEDEELKIIIGENQLKIELKNTLFFTTLLKGEFFRYQALMYENGQTKIETSRRDIIGSLERANLLAKEGKANLVKLESDDKYLNISSASEGIGNVEEKVDISIEGDPIVIGFNSKYLLDGIKIMDEENITMEFKDSINPCIIREGEDFIYLVLPVRLAV